MTGSQASEIDSQNLADGITGNTQHDLSKRELEIVELVAAGFTNQEISQQLEISKRTVDNHVSNILSKTATGNRVALVRWALQSGKVCIDELNCCRLPNTEVKAL
ncbi:MAG: LuxR C-terminal-related transcriptional regulator [Phormidesmis sp.]